MRLSQKLNPVSSINSVARRISAPLDVRGGNCEPILNPLSRLRERAGERETCRRRFERARLYGTHVPLAILVLYRVGSVSA